MKSFLFLLMSMLIVFSMAGCEQPAEESMKDKIDIVPNEEYVGDPNPPVHVEMKLTPEEQAEFEKLKQEIQSEVEVE
ncbi:hypothetical protein R4Z10_12690 [Niallia sp. XMNu-256]|uniref:hypothetical protein n=1 Tax=Niallia sp. XMNu-256 TaxID=3082444 RepID=UPI0030D243E1